LAVAGALVTLGNEGKATVHCGYIRPEDTPPKPRASKSVTLPDGTIITPEPEIHSSRLIESLTAHQSAGLSAALLERPTIALAVTVHVMALQVFYNGHSDDRIAGSAGREA
jgi:hypothetical protein